LRVRALGAVVGISTILISAAAAPAALGDDSGGVSPSAPTPPPAPAAPASPTPAAPLRPPIHLSPVTTRLPRLQYHGPVYERTATGAVVPYIPLAPGGELSAATGGSVVGVAAAAPAKPQLLVPGLLARYVGGLAAAPIGAPEVVQQAIWAGNQIIGLPYIFGGGHSSFNSPGYDCSGTVSFALHGGGLIAVPLDSSEFMLWGSHGVGRWVTIFSDPGHAYVDIAGLRLDTSGADDPTNQQGPRWRPLRAANGGYAARHPLGL
jgi:cell wall-associated NlpC family hydrolase